MRTRSLLSTLSLLSLLACATNQTTPGTIRRLVTVPSNAKVFVERLGMGPMYSPIDLSNEIRTSDTITIHHPGYKVWKKQLSEAWQAAEGTYKVVLEALPQSNGQ